LNVESNARSGLVVFTGTPSELARVEDSLTAWASQTGAAARKSSWQYVWKREGDRELVVLTGAALAAELPIVKRTLSTSVMDDRVAKSQETGYLRPYQAAAVRAAIVAPFGRGIIKVPTGGGKTRIACALARAVGGLWVYVVPNRQLARQTQLEAPNNMYCSSFNSVSCDVLQDCTGLIVDECHRIAAKSWVRIPLRSAACWRVGLSGTPLLRQDSRNSLVIGILGPIIYEIKKKILEEEGFLSKGTFKTVSI
jgi:superfamily II DNA or RNA helicase